MSPSEYTTALSTLGMDNKAAAEWLGIGLRTQQRYAKNGPCGMASRAVKLADKVSCIETELRQAVLVAYLRGAKEWAVKNYPAWTDWLNSHEEYTK